MSPVTTASGSQLTPESSRSLAEPIQHAFAEAVTSGIQAVFLVGAAVAAVGFGVSWPIRHVPLREAPKTDTAAGPTTPTKAERVPVAAGTR